MWFHFRKTVSCVYSFCVFSETKLKFGQLNLSFLNHISKCIFEVYMFLLGLQSGYVFIALACLNRLALAFRFAVAF